MFALVNENQQLTFAVGFAFDQSFSYTDSSVDTDCGSSHTEHLGADPVGVINDAGAGDLDVRNPVIERCHGIPEVRLSAAYAAMANGDRPDACLIEAGNRTVGEGFRAFTADFEEAVAQFMVFITELFDKTAFIEMGAPLTMIVNTSAIGEFGTLEAIDSRESLEGEVM